MAILEMTGITKDYQKGEMKVHALRGIDFTIEKGEFLSVVGPSGSGKSTMLNILGCLDTPSTGTVVYDGTTLGAMPEKELAEYRKFNIGFIFQSYNLIQVLSARENIELPLVIERRHTQAEIDKRVDELIEAVGLSGMADRRPKELSGGQEQRVAVARALVKDPLIVLADEPTANLDSETGEDVMNLMERMNNERGTTFLFSTHDDLVMKHAKRIVHLHDGVIEKDERK